MWCEVNVKGEEMSKQLENWINLDVLNADLIEIDKKRQEASSFHYFYVEHHTANRQGTSKYKWNYSIELNIEF